MEIHNTQQISPRIIAAIFYTIISLLATILVQLMLHGFGMGELIPWHYSLLLTPPIAWCSAWCFGRLIIFGKSRRKLLCFFWGVCVVLVSLPLYDLCLLFLLRHIHPSMYRAGESLAAYFQLYLMMVCYSLILIGSWLALLSGFAALYLRHSFAPRFYKLSEN